MQGEGREEPEQDEMGEDKARWGEAERGKTRGDRTRRDEDRAGAGWEEDGNEAGTRRKVITTRVQEHRGCVRNRKEARDVLFLMFRSNPN